MPEPDRYPLLTDLRNTPYGEMLNELRRHAQLRDFEVNREVDWLRRLDGRHIQYKSSVVVKLEPPVRRSRYEILLEGLDIA